MSDDDGIKVFDYTGRRLSTVRSFLPLHDFAVTAPGQIAVSPISREEHAPIVALLSGPTGVIAERWGETRVGLRSGLRAAHLASCHGLIVVGLVYAPSVVLLDDELNASAEMELPFPSKEALQELGQDERLVSPAPGVLTAPTFVSGVACAGETIFVLLDLPWLCLLEYSLDGGLLALYHSDIARPGRHYRKLDVTLDAGEIRLVTIADDGEEGRAIVQAIAVPAS